LAVGGTAPGRAEGSGGAGATVGDGDGAGRGAAGAEADGAGSEAAAGAAGVTAHQRPAATKSVAPSAGSHIGVFGSSSTGAA
jgi:hypothetical protein